MHLNQIRPRLWRWTARHPEAHPNPKPGSSADWPPEVGSVAYDAGDALVLIDPLVPAEDEQAFLRELDGLVPAGKRVHVLTTISFHRRSREQLAARYGASISRARAQLPDGVQTVPIRRAGEVMFWIPGDAALVPGDRLLGDGHGGLRLCPESWLGYLGPEVTPALVREAMRPLLELPVEMVLVSHGDPVLSGGREKIAAAIEGSA